MLLKRMRGLLTSMFLWSIPWSLFGLAVGLAYVLGLMPNGMVIQGPAILGGLPVTLALTGAVIGALNGLAFGVIVVAAERRHELQELRPVRIGTWAALATGATVFVLTTSVILATICGAFGFATGVFALRLARKAPAVEALDAAT